MIMARRLFKRVACAVALAMLIPMGVKAGHAHVGKRADALDVSAWSQSVWISAANAPVDTGVIRGGNCRAADGASIFLSTLKNEKKVASVKWMT